MKKNLLFHLLALYFLLLSATSLSAKDLNQLFYCSSKSKVSIAKSDLLNKIQTNYSSLKTFEARFKQSSYLAALDEGEISSGTTFYKAFGRMRWDYLVPELKTFILDEKKVIYYVPADRQAVVEQLDKVLITKLPVSFLLGVGTLAEKFIIKGTPCHNKSALVVDLEAKKAEEQGDLKSFLLRIDSKSFYPIGAKIIDVGGNINIFVFEESKYNELLPKDTFKLKKSEEVFLQDNTK
jgi:outer membrane lipoprotein-sorting protein